MSTEFLNDERLMDLLAQRATEGLNASERMELERLLARYPGVDAEILENTSSALLLASTIKEEPLPSALRNRLSASAESFISTSATNPKATVSRLDVPARATGRNSPVAWIAAAACLILAVIAWWPQIHTSGAPQVAREQPSLEEKLAQEREQLVATSAAVQQPWTNTGDANATGVAGDIVWDNQTQKGYMRFHGLAPNDPSKHQYQLWIFDKTRSDKYPVDGGVFDVPPSGGDVIVPIHAKLQVRDPAMFAVTLEQPGGAVVSEREHILVLAKVTAG